MRALTKNKKSHLTRKMFFDGGTDIARYDEVKFPVFVRVIPGILTRWMHPVFVKHYAIV